MILLLIRESSSRFLERVHETSPRFAKPRPPTEVFHIAPALFKVRFLVRL